MTTTEGLWSYTLYNQATMSSAAVGLTMDVRCAMMRTAFVSVCAPCPNTASDSEAPRREGERGGLHVDAQQLRAFAFARAPDSLHGLELCNDRHATEDRQRQARPLSGASCGATLLWGARCKERRHDGRCPIRIGTAPRRRGPREGMQRVPVHVRSHFTDDVSTGV